jgi:hypothetical protein
MNVLIIPEDFRKDQYILGPIVKKMFEEIGKPRAKVQMCLDPLLGGISQALRWERILEIIDMVTVHRCSRSRGRPVSFRRHDASILTT